MALEGRTIVHAQVGVNVPERLPIASRQAANVSAPAAADRFMTDSPNASRMASPAAQAQRPPQKWSTGLFAVHRGICCGIYTLICPCLVVGRIGGFLNPSTSKYRHCFCCLAFCCLSTCRYRGQIRKQFNLPKEPCGDFSTHLLCTFCALCQENRELTRRGVDLRWIYPKLHCGSPTCRGRHPPGGQHPPCQVEMHK